MNRLSKLKRRTQGVAVKTKVGYENLNIADKAVSVSQVSRRTWEASRHHLKNLFKKPVRTVSHFGLVIIILVVLLSGVPAPKSLNNPNQVPVDPFGMVRSTVASDEEVDLTELEILAMATSLVSQEKANQIYEKIGASETKSQIVLAGNAIANSTVIDTQSSAEIKNKYQNYVVQGGDTLSVIASRFGVTTNSIKWSNANVKNIDNIKPGMTLRIPSVSGIVYKVQKGDSVESIAARYKSKASLIVSFNDLYGESIKAGMTILIPNGQKTDPKPAPTTTTRVASSSSGGGRYGSSSYIARSGSFLFPTRVRSGNCGNGIGYRDINDIAYDLCNSYGTPIYASDSGRVTSSYGFNGGYGNMILIDHGDGFVTRYAHLSTIKIRGGYVSRGTVIGYMGSTGYSTGPHLHFEILRNGAKQYPGNYL